MEWNIYKNGNLINTIYADENFVKELCEENGWTYAPYGQNPNPSPSITPYQRSLLDEFDSIQSRILAFIQDHSWAITRETFDLATRQYDAMVEYYIVLSDRIRYEGLESYVTIDSN